MIMMLALYSTADDALLSVNIVIHIFLITLKGYVAHLFLITLKGYVTTPNAPNMC